MSGIMRPGAMAAHEVEREARRVLRRLCVARALLVALDKDRFAVSRNPATAATSRLKIGGDFVRAFLDRGWIASAGAGRFACTDEGARFSDGANGPAGRLMRDAVIGGDGDGGAGAGTKVRVNMAESPLSRLAYRRLIEPTQFAAGEKLRRDFTLAQMMPRMGVDLSAPVVSGRRGGGGENISDTALAARQRLSRALGALGPELGGLAFDVCCHLITLEQAEGQRHWAKRAGRVVLKIALDRLAAHYGIGVTARSDGRIRAWAQEVAETVTG